MFKEIILSLALSNHVGFDNNYNEIHPHIRFKTDNTISGAFYNSERTISFYTGKEFTFDTFIVYNVSHLRFLILNSILNISHSFTVNI